MADILISKFTTQIPRVGATPATPGFAESEGQDPTAPSGTPIQYGIGAGLSLDSLNQIQLGNTGAGFIDFSNSTEFPSGIRFAGTADQNSIGFQAYAYGTVQPNIGANIYTVYSEFGTSYTAEAGIGLDQLNLLFTDADNVFSAVFTDGYNSRGLVYGGDYEANFLSRSLVTKQYVDGAISGAGHNPVTIGSPANGLSISGTQVLTIGLASTSTTGALSSTDWNTFNGKIGGSIASGQVAFGTGVNTVGGDSGLTWDNVNKRLSLNGSTQASTLGIIGSIIIQSRTDAFQNGFIQIRHNATNLLDAGAVIESNKNGTVNVRIDLASDFISFSTAAINSARVERWQIISSGILQSLGAQQIRTSTGNLTLATAGGNGNIFLTPNGTGQVGIATTSPSNTLDVNGTARIRTINNLGSAATSVLVPSATGVVSLRTLAELASDMGTVTLATGDARYLRKDVADTKAGNLTMSTGSLFMNAVGAQISYSTTSPGPASFIFNSTTRSGTFSLRQNNTVYLKNDVAGILYNAPIFMYNVAIDTTPASSNINFGILTNGDLLLNTTNGVKIGTATNQKLAFYNSTPIVQPSGDILTALSNLGLIASPTITQVDQFSVKTTASADQTLPSGTLTILDYDSTLLNNSTATYTVATDGRITINTTGVYTITAGVVIEADAVTALESAFLGIFRNGDLVAISSINTTIAAGAQSGLSTSTILSLTATDIIDCRALVNSVGGVANGLARRLGTLLGANATQVNSLSITKNSM